METEFDPLKESRLLANKYPSRAAAKLTLEQRCEAYAALYQGVAQILVATTFGLSRASISALTNCRKDTRPPLTMELPDLQTFTEEILTDDKQSTRRFVDVVRHNVRTYTVGDLNMTKLRRSNATRKPRYQDVAREFDRLGETAFIQTYFTPHLKARIQEAAKKRPVYGVPDPEADRYSFANAGEITDKWGEKFQINFVASRIGEGWQFIVSRDGIPSERHEYNGDDGGSDKDKPFMSSDAARAFLLGL